MGGQPGKPKPPGNPPIRPEPQEPMALKVEGVVDGGMRAEKTLGGTSRFKALQFALSSSLRLM